MYQISHWENSNLYKKKEKDTNIEECKMSQHKLTLEYGKKIFPHGNNPHFLTGEVLLQPDQN